MKGDVDDERINSSDESSLWGESEEEDEHNEELIGDCVECEVGGHIADRLSLDEHRMCARHIYANWKKKHSDDVLKTNVLENSKQLQ